MSARGGMLGMAPAVLVGVAAYIAGLSALWAVVLSYHALCFGAALGRREPVGLRHPSGRWMWVSIALAAAGAVAIWAAGRLALSREWIPPRILGSIRSLEPWPLLAYYSLVVNPFAEELY